MDKTEKEKKNMIGEVYSAWTIEPTCDDAPSPPTVIHSKAKKSLALRKHPPYLEERNGSSQYAIGKFIIEDKHKDLPVNFKKMLLNLLKKLVAVLASDKLVKVKASYKLPSKILIFNLFQ
ncbi:histone H1 [Artemisia annua]|uniref:Histone H1 n=1 Tax=Artemisia annua TaxID=35608 RepID=A0A2U1L9X7_ARTAN|nr:histone H1 [Artemisia annua]